MSLLYPLSNFILNGIGDFVIILVDIKNEKGSLTELMDIAKNYFMIKGGFGPADVVSDFDAPIIFKKKNDNNDFADIIRYA